MVTAYLFDTDATTTHTTHSVIEIDEEAYNNRIPSVARLHDFPANTTQERHVAEDVVHSLTVVAGALDVECGDPDHPESVHLGPGAVAIFQDSKGTGHRAITGSPLPDKPSVGAVCYHAEFSDRF